MAATKPAGSAETKTAPANHGTAAQYCEGVAPLVERSKTAAEKEALTQLSTEIEQRISLLESKTAEHREWLAKREEFLTRARDSMVQIYARMKAESAAAQVAEMDPLSAAATLARMEPKAAGAILAEIEPAKAARISNVIAGLADITQPNAGQVNKATQR